MNNFFAAIIRALQALQSGSWKIIDGVWTWVRLAVGGGAPSMPAFAPTETADESTCRNSPASETELAVSLKQWASNRAAGMHARLPNGITPVAAGWAVRLAEKELAVVGRSSADMIAAHLSGSAAIAGVRPVVVRFELEDDQAARLTALRARGARIRAALVRTNEAYHARTAAPAV